MDLSNILRRIQKLLAIAQDSRADPNEAAAAAGQAARLMAKFQLDHADVLRAEIASKAARFGKHTCSASMKRDVKRTPVKRFPQWASHLAVRVAMLNDVQVRLVRLEATVIGGGGIHAEFAGLESDAQVAAWTFEYLVGETIRGCAAYQKSARRSKVESDSFRKGFVGVLCARLREAEREKRAESTSDSRALVVQKMALVEEHFGKAEYGKSRSTSISDPAAHASGRTAAERVDVHRRGVGGSPAAAATGALPCGA